MKSTGRTWVLAVPPSATSLTLPGIPDTPIRSGESYSWRVTSHRFDGADFDGFRWDQQEALSGDVAETPLRTLDVL